MTLYLTVMRKGAVVELLLLFLDYWKEERSFSMALFSIRET